MNRESRILRAIGAILVLICATTMVFGQSTAFNFQGNLTDNGQPANGIYDFRFELYDAQEAGSAVGSPITINAVQVTNGSFSVTLDFGDQFPGAARWLEIAVDQTPAAGNSNILTAFAVLGPRHPIQSVPFSIRSLSSASADIAATADNALSLGGVTSSDYVVTSDSRLSDARTPTAGSTDYIQNGTTQQAGSNFNISGTGTANRFDAATQFNLRGDRFIAYDPLNANQVVGDQAGRDLTTGQFNLFVGPSAGRDNESGSQNTFIGVFTGGNNITGGDNTIIGYRAGSRNADGSGNTFVGSRTAEIGSINSSSLFGSNAGHETTGDNNAFFGFNAGYSVRTGTGNSIFGTRAGEFSSGNVNVFLGVSSGRRVAGDSNTFIGSSSVTGITNSNNNTVLGANSNVSDGLEFATAIGARSHVSASNAIVLGSIDGVNGATASTRVGIGTQSPSNVFTVIGNGTQTGGVSGFNEIVARFRQSSGAHLGVSIDSVTGQDPILYLSEDGQAVWGIRNDSGNDTFQIRYHSGGANTTRVSISTTGIMTITGTLAVSNLGSAGAATLCRNASNQISTCSSSIRYKNNIENFSSGFDLIQRLRPVSFNWKDGGMLDLGLVAEEVAEIEPLLVTYNRSGSVEGVKYDRIGVVLLNVVKEQQKTIESLREKLERQEEKVKEQDHRSTKLETQITAQGEQIEALKALICASKAEAAVCNQ